MRKIHGTVRWNGEYNGYPTIVTSYDGGGAIWQFIEPGKWYCHSTATCVDRLIDNVSGKNEKDKKLKEVVKELKDVLKKLEGVELK